MSDAWRIRQVAKRWVVIALWCVCVCVRYTMSHRRTDAPKQPRVHGRRSKHVIPTLPASA